MRKSFLIARSNLRKSKGQTTAIVVLVLIAALMLNLWLMLATDYKANFDRYHDELNGEHITLAVDNIDGSREFLEQTISTDSSVDEYVISDCLSMTGNFKFNGGEMNSWFVITEKQEAISRSIGRVEITKDSGLTSGIYFPMLYESDEVRLGETVEINIGSHKVSYTVCGFFNNVMMGSHNCMMSNIVLTEDKFEELQTLGYAPSASLCSIRLNDKSTNMNYSSLLKSKISEQFPNITVINNSYDVVSQSRYISQMICSAIMSVIAFLVLLIAIVIIVSNIVNYIQVNLKNLGALKAVGYTSSQLVIAFLLQFVGVTLITALVGASLSYAVFPVINTMMIMQTGIPYAIHFLPLPFFLSLVILCGTIALAVWFSSRKIKKIEPIVALRSGVQTHNFKKNHIPLEKTKMPLSFALALKSTFSGVKHNVTVFITMMVLSLIVVFSAVAVENIISDITPFLNIIVGETADSCINISTEAEDEFLQKMDGDERVEKVYLFTTLNIVHSGGAELSATMCDDFSKLNNQNVVYKGRFPKYDNETAIAAKYAREQGFDIGQEIDFTLNGKTVTYLICGFTQVSNYLGRDCLLTRDGFERLGDMSMGVSYYLNIADGVDIDAFNAEIKDAFAGQVNAVINVESTLIGNAGVYVSLIEMIVVAILFISIVIIAFVLYLLVRTMLNNKRQDYGIQKALGFTTSQLILQTALTFMPSAIISTVVGLIVSCFAINPLLSLFLSSIGIMKCTFAIPVGMIVGCGFALVAVSFALACILSMGIRKIAPRTLLVGE